MSITPEPLTNMLVTIMLTVALVCFLVSEITRNYSQVDKLWSLIPIVYGWITVAASPRGHVSDEEAVILFGI